MSSTITPVSNQYLNYSAQFKSKKNSSVSGHAKEKEGMSTAAKVALTGLGIAGALGIAMLAIKMGKAPKGKSNPQINVENKIRRYKSLFISLEGEDKKIIEHILKNAETLPPEKQAKLFKYLDNINIRKDSLKYGPGKVRGVEIPTEILKLYNEGRTIKAAQALEKYALSLPNTYKAKSTGATVAETIENVFGKGSKIKPHSYDLSKECDHFMFVRNCGGYYDDIVTNAGVVRECRYFEYSEPLSRSFTNFNNFLITGKVSKIGNDALIHSGIVDGKYVTIMEIPEKNCNNFMRLGFVSKNDKPSPLQNDLLSLVENPEKFNYDFIDKMMLMSNKGKVAHMDYDLMLSAIQSMAK